MEISKKDWKLFREKLAVWQENYMDRLIKDYIALLSAGDRNASDKFWELDNKIRTDRRHPGVILNVRKSEAIYDILRLIRLGVITYEDLSDFSEELQQTVKLILDR
ncbi:MAG TPA: hypothetical protein H9935_11680 [Candidatus Blautia merdigallinarum]|uniref:Multidrug transporter n=1 Tax=Candidatus Blautia merdigallinarum TaxID=2838495 RepID=A0A9D2SLQ8_9FIRM|nr:hypothetical protein [Candidatus Blautia merdigallinarum]